MAAALLVLPQLPALAGEAIGGPRASAPVPHVHPPDAPEDVHRALDSPYPRPAGRRARGADSPVTAFVPVALVDFADNPATFPRGELEAMLFQNGYPHGAGSFADFYAEQSGGLFAIEGQTTPWLRMPRPYSEYVGSNHGMQMSGTNAWTLVQDAVAAADPSTDFCRADTDRDGFADTLALLHAGPGAAETGRGLWAISWSLPSAAITNDTCANGQRVRVKNFIIVPERHADTSLSAPGAPKGLATIGTVVHEFGHVLGLPDLYDTSFETPGGVGTWDVMGTGSWGFSGRTPWRPTPLSAWCRVRLGWAHPIDVREDRLEVPLASSDAPRNGIFQGVLRLTPKGDASSTDYFLIERRTPAGFGADFPRDGILVWRIAPEGSRRRVYLVQADGRDDLGRAGSSWAWGDSGDMFPGRADVREVDDTTTPSLRLSTGAPSGIALAGIRDGGTALSMFVTPPPEAPPAPPAGVAAVREGAEVTVSWTRSPDPGVFEYRILRRAGGGQVRIASVPGTTTTYRDAAPPADPIEYVVRAYNRRESADSNIAAPRPVADGERSYPPSHVAVAVGTKVRGNAASLAAADGRVLEIASARLQGRHRVTYLVTVPVSGDPTSLTITGLVDRRLRAFLSLRRPGGVWNPLGRVAATPMSRFSLPVPEGGHASGGSVILRITESRRRPFAHKVNVLGVVAS